MVNKSDILSIPLSTRKRKVSSTTPEFTRKIRRFETLENSEMSSLSEIESPLEKTANPNLLEPEAGKNPEEVNDGDNSNEIGKENDDVIPKTTAERILKELEKATVERSAIKEYVKSCVEDIKADVLRD